MPFNPRLNYTPATRRSGGGMTSADVLDIIEREKNLNADAKAIDGILGRNPELLEELGTGAEQFSNLSSREKVAGFNAALGSLNRKLEQQRQEALLREYGDRQMARAAEVEARTRAAAADDVLGQRFSQALQPAPPEAMEQENYVEQNPRRVVNPEMLALYGGNRTAPEAYGQALQGLPGSDQARLLRMLGDYQQATASGAPSDLDIYRAETERMNADVGRRNVIQREKDLEKGVDREPVVTYDEDTGESRVRGTPKQIADYRKANPPKITPQVQAELDALRASKAELDKGDKRTSWDWAGWGTDRGADIANKAAALRAKGYGAAVDEILGDSPAPAQSGGAKGVLVQGPPGRDGKPKIGYVDEGTVLPPGWKRLQ